MSNTDGADTQRIEVPTWYTENEMHQWLLRNNYSENIAKELSGMYANYLQGSFKVGFEKGQRSQEKELASLREQLETNRKLRAELEDELSEEREYSKQKENEVKEKEEVIRELIPIAEYGVYGYMRRSNGTLNWGEQEQIAKAIIEKAKSLTTKDK